jgi:hypothetical protein
MQQQDSRDDGFGHALSGGPAHLSCLRLRNPRLNRARLMLPGFASDFLASL